MQRRDDVPRTRAWVMLGAMAAAGLALRLWSLGFGLPAVYNMDEVAILNRALTFAKGDPNPHNFLYPTLYFYALFAWEGLYFVVGRAAGWFASLGAFQNAFIVDPTGHYLAARGLGALCGTLTIVAVYLFGARLHGRRVGLAAALFLALAPVAVRDAHYVKLDVPVTLFATLAFAALAAIPADADAATRSRRWILAGAIAGLAISTHYYAAYLAVPFVAAAIADGSRHGRWGTSVTLLMLAGVATLGAFALTSPFFAFEPSAVVRDLTELREVDIDRAVTHGLFSSLPAYTGLLARAVGAPVFVLGIGGALLALADDWRRSLPAVSFLAAFLAFVSNTYPASRYLNIMLPPLAVLAAYTAWRLARFASGRASIAMVAVCGLAALPALMDSVRWDRFFGQDDTRTLARRFIEREVPPGSTVLVQPYSAPIEQSREGLIEALRLHLGDESRASTKFQLRLAATPYPAPAYRILYVGESGKGDAPPGDVDKIYLSPRAFGPSRGLEPLRAAGVQYVVMTRYGPTPEALAPLEFTLRHRARPLATFSPYRPGVQAAAASVPPFRHNGNTWIDAQLQRPGPIVEIWKVE